MYVFLLIVEAGEFLEYCKNLFQFKTITVRRFRLVNLRWLSVFVFIEVCLLIFVNYVQLCHFS
jgi:hypothetical protein